LDTFAVAEDASGEPAWALMTGSNLLPFCSSATRREIGVLDRKKAAQLASIAACALDGAVPDALAEVVGDAGGDELGCDDDVPLLPQAATAKPAAAPRAGTSKK
jgi:hypothetical protein